jgi:hypothetical protein
MILPGKEEKREKSNICAADIYKPAVTQHSSFIHGIRRNIYLKKMKQKAKSKQGEQNDFLCGHGSVTQKKV